MSSKSSACAREVELSYSDPERPRRAPRGDARPWWSEDYGFFGEFYMDGDDSKQGYLSGKKQRLDERTSAETAGVVRLLGLVPGQRVLDCPCGYGRHSVSLAEQGLSVVGVDLSSTHLKKASERARRAGVGVDFRNENMLSLRYGPEFDAVINMFYSFGFFETEQENGRVLRSFFEALKPGGRFLMHTDVNIQRIRAGSYKQDERRSLTSGGSLRILDHFDPTTRRINGAWIIADASGAEVRKSYSVRVYEKDEFIQMCLSAGFRRCEAYGCWAGSPYSRDCEDIMFVAEK